MNISALFSCVPFHGGVAIVASSATIHQALALANYLDATRVLGPFRQLFSAGSSELRVAGRSLEAVQAALMAIPMEDLKPYVEAIEAAQMAELKAAEAAKALQAMTLTEFGKHLHSRSGSKLLPSSTSSPPQKTLNFKSFELMPVTHFKALAKLAPYSSVGQLFSYFEPHGVNLPARQKLLMLADKLAKSTKTVTREDVMARRAAKRAASKEPTADEIQDFIMDVYGFGEDLPSHIESARKALREAFKR